MWYFFGSRSQNVKDRLNCAFPSVLFKCMSVALQRAFSSFCCNFWVFVLYVSYYLNLLDFLWWHLQDYTQTKKYDKYLKYCFVTHQNRCISMSIPYLKTIGWIVFEIYFQKVFHKNADSALIFGLVLRS